MPNVQRDPLKEFEKGKRIKGATGFWSVDEVADKKNALGLKHMMPDSKTFARACGKSAIKEDGQRRGSIRMLILLLRTHSELVTGELGIARDSKVVVYDTHGLFSAPRTLFTFKVRLGRPISASPNNVL